MLQLISEPLFEFPESYSKFPLAICFIYGIVNFYVMLSIHLPFSLLPSPPCPKICSLCLFLYCCPENKFINATFLDSIYMCQYTLFMLFNIELIFCQLTHLLGSQLNIYISIHHFCCFYFVYSSAMGVEVETNYPKRPVTNETPPEHIVKGNGCLGNLVKINTFKP